MKSLITDKFRSLLQGLLDLFLDLDLALDLFLDLEIYILSNSRQSESKNNLHIRVDGCGKNIRHQLGAIATHLLKEIWLMA